MSFNVKPNKKLFLFFMLVGIACDGLAIDASYAGNVKALALSQSYSEGSIGRYQYGSNYEAQNASARFQFSLNSRPWEFNLDYQFIALHFEQAGTGSNSSNAEQSSHALNDDGRFLDLSYTLDERDDLRLIHRLDRFNISYKSNNFVIRLGRQALSWGNGLFFSPMDFVNPFNPTTVDKEFKAGDDMLYAQQLFSSGNDIQAAWVARRDADGNHGEDLDSQAVKYHAFFDQVEIDLIAGRHFGERLGGVGFVSSFGGGVLRSDVIATSGESSTTVSGVANYSVSWNMLNKNMSGNIEYFYNGLGISRDDYENLSEKTQPDLWKKLQRGELFVVARHYLAAGVQIELNPLWNLSLNDFQNVEDASGLVQVISQHDLKTNLLAYISITLPYGNTDTEFGGYKPANSPYSTASGWGVSAQCSWYF